MSMATSGTDYGLCPWCGDGPECIGTLNHIECVRALRTKLADAQAHLTALIERACGTCGHQHVGACLEYGLPVDELNERGCAHWEYMSTEREPR